MIAEEYRGARKWSRNQQAIAIVVWISFLSAAVATMLFFAAFDPVELGGLLDTDLNATAAMPPVSSSSGCCRQPARG